MRLRRLALVLWMVHFPVELKLERIRCFGEPPRGALVWTLSPSALPPWRCSVAPLRAGPRGFGDKAEVVSHAEQYETKRGKKRTSDAVEFFRAAQKLVSAEKHEEAVPLYKKARVAMGKAGGTKSADYARVCSNLASTYLHLGAPQRAAELYVEAADAFAHSCGKSHPEYAGCLRNLARVPARMGMQLRRRPCLSRR